MAIQNSEEPPQTKKMKMCRPRSSSSSWSLSSLPDELVMSCLVRVSRSDQGAMSLVSKSYQSLMASPELYSTRSVLGYAENCVYVGLICPRDRTPSWFMIPGRKKLMRGPITSPPYHPTEGFSVVAVEWGLYVIGGRRNKEPTCKVFFLDCRTHRWHLAPSMGVDRVGAAAGVIGGKIYVFGGCPNGSPNWGEVFDPKTQTWDSLPPMPYCILDRFIHSSFVVSEEKLYAVDITDYPVYYSPNEGTWGTGNYIRPSDDRNRRDWCVVDGLIYCIDQRGCLYWCEPELLQAPKPSKTYWREVKGLDSLQGDLSSSELVHFDTEFDALWESERIESGEDETLIDLLPGARLSSSGGNIVLFWEVRERNRRNRAFVNLLIWSAEISLERRRQGPLEIWGNVVWSNYVKNVELLSYLDRYKILHSVAVTL